MNSENEDRVLFWVEFPSSGAWLGLKAVYIILTVQRVSRCLEMKGAGMDIDHGRKSGGGFRSVGMG